MYFHNNLDTRFFYRPCNSNLIFELYSRHNDIGLAVGTDYVTHSLISTVGVTQGSVLGPLLFILYTTPLSSLNKASSIYHHLYADDTQVFFSFAPSSLSDTIDHIMHLVKQISSWMS